MPIYMLDIPMTKALDLWSQLERAYHGTNSYGGDEAEIYAYQLLSRDPLAENGSGPMGQEAREQAALRAAQSLHGLLSYFAETREANIRIDGRRLGQWMLKTPLEHRCHVKVKPRRK